jgi:hypothetical protein
MDAQDSHRDTSGLSGANHKYMRYFASECPDRVIGQQAADQLPWFHIVTLITKIHDPALREWYAREALAQSRFDKADRRLPAACGTWHSPATALSHSVK